MRPKDIGTAAETAVVRWLRVNGFGTAERRALRGRDDAGDITGLGAVMLEVKAGNQAQAPADGLLATWKAEVVRQRRAADAEVAALILRRRGHGSPEDWWAYITLYDLDQLLRPGEAPLGARYDGVWLRMHLGDLVPIMRRAGYGDPLD